MPRVLTIEDDARISLAECVDALSASGFDPRDEHSLSHAALQLRRLGNDQTFLGDMLIRQLADDHRNEGAENRGSAYGAQVIMLHPPGHGPFFLRANIWPSEAEHMMRANGGTSFVYGLPHDHNFDFLTLGYFGPGYWSDYYEFDYEAVAGWSGEPVDLRFVERAKLDHGKIMHYRAHRDVHRQLAADSLSVSINVMHAFTPQGWLDQYGFDLDKGCVARILNHGSAEALMRIAVGLGGQEAIDLAHRFGHYHPSDRMQLHAWSALASLAGDDAACDRVWQEAEQSGSRMVAMTAAQRRATLSQPEPAPV